MRIAKIMTSLLILFVFGSTLTAQTDIISAADFMTLTKSSNNLVLVDANKSKTYANSHIKNAIHIGHKALYKEGDVSALIKSPEELAAYFGEKGINENTEVVIYDDGSHKYNSRVYWILKYIGAKNVKLLHKDMNAWRKMRVPLTSTPGKSKATTFTPEVNENILATLDYVKENKENENVVLVDVRSPEEYNGSTSKSDGHIPGAINLNYEDLLTENGAFKSKEELQAIADANGLTADKELIFSCNTGIKGSVSFAAFKSILGYEKVKLFDGSYVEWVVDNSVVQ